MKEKTIALNGTNIAYTVLRKPVKHIHIRIRGGRVFVSANRLVSEGYIEALLHSKAAWILKRLNEQNASVRAAMRFEEGSELFLLGRRYPLTVVRSFVDEVVIGPESIEMHVSRSYSDDEKRALYLKWLKEYAVDAFNASLERMLSLAAGVNLQKPRVTVRVMKTRWGSCSVNKNRITLNLSLIQARPACIDYVVLHELIHFIHPNHGKQFYAALQRYMPNWKQSKAELRQIQMLEKSS